MYEAHFSTGHEDTSFPRMKRKEVSILLTKSHHSLTENFFKVFNYFHTKDNKSLGPPVTFSKRGKERVIFK